MKRLAQVPADGRRSRSGRILAAATAGALAAAGSASAGVFTWQTTNPDGTGASDNYSTGFGPTPPPSDFTTQLVFIPGNYTATANIGDPFNLNAITVNNADANTLNLNGFEQFIFGGSNPTFQVNGGSVAFQPQLNTATGAQIINAGGGTLTLANGFVFGPGATTITNAGPGSIILADSPTPYFGTNAVINLANTGAGTFSIGNLGSVAGVTTGVAGTINVTAGTVAFSGNPGLDLFGPGLILNVASNATFNFNNNAEGFGGLTGAGNVILGTAGLTFQAPGDRTFSGSISGTGAVAQGVAAVLTLGGGNNTYSGTTTVNNGGTIRLSTANGLSPNSVVSVTNGTLDLGGFSQTTTGLTGGNTRGTLPLGGATLTIDPAAGTSYSFNSALTGPGNVVVNGPGTENLSQNNTYVGTTTVSAGTLRLNVGGLVGTAGSATVAAGATLDALVPVDATAGSYFNGAGAFVKEGAGNLTFAASNAAFAPSSVAVTAGTLTLDQRADNGNKLGTPAPLTLAGGSLALIGNGSAAAGQTFNGLALGIGLGGGGGQVTVTATNGQPATLTLGAVTRGMGTTLDFNPVGTGASIAAGLTNVNGTVGGWATYGGGTTWVVANADGTVGPLTTYTANTFGASTHTDVTSSFAPASSATTVDVRFNTPAAATTLTLAGTTTLTNGGILVTPAVGANTTNISSGTLVPSANTDLVVDQFDTQGGLIITSILGNKAGSASTATGTIANGSTGVAVSSTAGLFVGEGVSGTNISSGTHITAINAATSTVTLSNAATTSASGVALTFTVNTNLVKAGPGTLTLGRTSSYAGSTYINGGVLALSGTASTTYLGLAQDPIYFNGGTLSFAAGNIGTVAPANHPITVGPGGATFDFGANQTFQGSGLSGAGPIVKTGAGILSVGSNGSLFAGTIAVNAGGLTESSSVLTRATGLTMAANTQFQITDDAVASFGIAVGAPVVLGGGMGLAGNANPGAFVLVDQNSGTDDAFGPTTTFTNPFTFLTDTAIGVYNLSAASPRVTTLVFPNPVTGGGNLVKLGSGVLVLANPNNSFGGGAGTVTIANGTLRLGADNGVPAAAVLQLGQTGATTSGTFDLNGFNQTVAGFSTAGSGNAEQVVNTSATAASVLTANAAAGTNPVFAGQLGGGTVSGPSGANFAFVKAGTGTLTLAGVNTFGGGVTVAAGGLRVAGGANNVARAYAVNDGANLIVANTDPAAPLQATTLTLGNGGASGLSFELNGGTPAATSAGALAVTADGGLSVNGTVNVAVASSGGSFPLGQFPLVRYAGSIGGAGFAGFNPQVSLPSRAIGSLVNDTTNHTIDLNVTGVDFIKYTGAVNGDWDVNATPNFALNSSGGATTYIDQPSPDSVVFDDTAKGTHTVNLAATLRPAAVTVNTAAGYMFAGSGSIAGTTGLNTSGPGTLTILTNNSYTGTTTISAGTVQIGNGGTTGTLGSGPVVNNGTLTVNRSDPVTVVNNITGSGSVVSTGGGTVSLSGTNVLGGDLSATTGGLAVVGTTTVTGSVSAAGGVTANGGVLQVGAGGTTGAISADVALVNNGTLAFANAGGGGSATAATVTDANAITGAGGVSVVAGWAKLTGAVGYTGTTAVGANTLEFASNSNTTLGGTVSGPGTITGTGTVIKSGTGTLSLLGSSNGFTGTLVVNGGAVQLTDKGGGGDLGAASVVVNAGGTFTFGPDGNPDFPDSTIVTVNAGGTFQLQQGESYGGIVLNGGTFVAGNGAAGSGTTAAVGYTFNSGTVTSSGAGTSTFNGPGNLDKYTDGTVTFTGAAAVNPALVINVHRGTLAFPAANFPTGNAASLTLGDAGSTGTIQLTDGAAAVTARPIVLQGNGGVIGVANAAGSLAVNTAITGTGPLGVTGAGTVIFNAANGYNGDTTIAGATLRANNPAGSGSATGNGTVVVASGGTLGGNGSVGSVKVNGGGTMTAGATAAAVGTLSATGAVTLAAGSTLLAKTDGTTADRLILSSLAPLPADGGVTVSLTAANASAGASVAPGATFVLATDNDATGANPFNASPATLASQLTLNVNPNVTVTGGGYFQFDSRPDTDAGGGYDLLLESVSAAPEPTSLLLLGLVAGPLTLGRRRRVASR